MHVISSSARAGFPEGIIGLSSPHHLFVFMCGLFLWFRDRNVQHLNVLFSPGIVFNMRSSGILRCLAYFLAFNASKAVPSSNRGHHVAPAHPAVKRAATCHTPTNRTCWSDGFDISTDYEEHFPATGIVREV